MTYVAYSSKSRHFDPFSGRFTPIRPTNQRRARKGSPTSWHPRNLVGPQRPSGHCSPASRPTPGPAGSGHSQTLPRLLLPATDRRIAKTERDPISTSGPSILLCTEPGEPYGKINPFFLARRRWTVDHSRAAGGAPRQGHQACLPDAHQTQCLLSRCSP
jgi:hypothetical protein